MIIRYEYLNKLIKFRDKKLIKVVTGIRRCGKSTLFEMYKDYLIDNGVSNSQIISINFENPDYSDITRYKELYSYIKERLDEERTNYVFLDEVQNVDEFERAVDGLFIKKNVDVYITGSNAYMLSGEIATLLSGRYVEIKMLPLSFKEYVSSTGDEKDLARKYMDYIRFSSFPYVLELDKDEEAIREYLSGLYNTVVLKDVVARKRISDVMMLESIIKFMFNNISNLVSIKKISDTMTSMGRKISTHTVESYVTALTNSYILYSAKRYDIRGKEYLRTLEKYYVVDIGLRYFLLGSKHVDTGDILENIIFLELKRRGYNVYVGKIDSQEVDFVAEKGTETVYYQVSATVRDENTLKRELASLDKINDHNPKYMITLDEEPMKSYNGIKQINAYDFLLGRY